MLDVPVFTAVARPLLPAVLEMVATLVLEDDQITDVVMTLSDVGRM